MNTNIKNYTKNIAIIDKYLLILIGFIPILLATSIFIADLFASFAGIILIYIFLKKDISFLESIKKELFLMIAFYLIILISLFISDFFKHSFLASFFYFRYFLVSLSIFYLLKKYDFLLSFFLFIIFGTISLVMFDATFQYFNGTNLFGYEHPNYNHPDPLAIKYLTSFFDQEKKLGSYLVRLLPLILGLVCLYNKMKYIQLNKFIILIFGIIIFSSSERTSLFLFFIVMGAYILVSQNKFKTILASILITLILFISNPFLAKKYVTFTLQQMEIIESPYYKSNKIRFISEEHENLIYSSLINFKKNFLFGSGVKTFHPQCKKNKEQLIENNNQRNKMQCSTHPHSTYFQILSDVGIFGFLIIFIFLCHIIGTIFKMLFKIKKEDRYFLSYYFINIGMLINLFPLIPSGSFFNNWICLMISYLFGFWLFLKSKYLKENI